MHQGCLPSSHDLRRQCRESSLVARSLIDDR
jgi:hypothetical protein